MIPKKCTAKKNDAVRGLDKILKEVGEESTEVVVAAQNAAPKELVRECADLTYHLLVLLVEAGMHPGEICVELKKRSKR